MADLCCGLNLLMIRKIPRMSVLSFSSEFTWLKKYLVEWRKKRLSVIHNRVSGNRAWFWLWNWFEILLLSHLIVSFHACSIGVASVFALAQQYHTSSTEIINLTSKWEKKVFVTHYILKWYCSYSWSIFLSGKILMLCFFHRDAHYTL